MSITTRQDLLRKKIQENERKKDKNRKDKELIVNEVQYYINDNKLFFNFSTECSFPFSLNINRLLSAICSRITFLNLSCVFNAPFFKTAVL
jgi:hypothetical protein